MKKKDMQKPRNVIIKNQQKNKIRWKKIQFWKGEIMIFKKY
jgi:hypothetical protein